jgi:hypothetical protein
LPFDVVITLLITTPRDVAHGLDTAHLRHDDVGQREVRLPVRPRTQFFTAAPQRMRFNR